MEAILEQYLNAVCCQQGCTTFRINGQCLIINSNHLIIN